jgi:dTDP-4-dehydrorhamnose reductase
MRLLITGAFGQLGGYLLRELANGEDQIIAWSGSRQGTLSGFKLHTVDLANADGVVTAFQQARPTVVIHAAAIASLVDCRKDPERAQQINQQGSAQLAELCHQAGARLLLVSTDLVFDGERGYYTEQDAANPLSVYGRTKVAAEQDVLAFPETLVVRLSLMFGPTVVRRPYFFDEQITALRERRPIRMFDDEWRTPLSLAIAARSLVALARSGLTGLLHLGGPERMTRLEMGERVARYLGADPSTIVATSRDNIPHCLNPAVPRQAPPEPRPPDVSLDSSRWRALFPKAPWPDLEQALAEMGL